MSLSKIIKAEAQLNEPLPGYRFGALDSDESRPPQREEPEFHPLFQDFDADRKGYKDEGAAFLPDGVSKKSPMPGLDEEELHQMIQEAFDNGFAEGRQQTEDTYNNACRALAEAASQVDGLKEKLFRDSEEELLQLALIVAKLVIHQEVSIDKKILAHFLAEATRGFTDQDEIVISLNPEDCRLVSANRHLYLGTGEKRHITLKPDESVSFGGCMVDTPTGVVDARIEAQLAEIFKRLMHERAHPGGGVLAPHGESEPYLSEQYGVEKYGGTKN